AVGSLALLVYLVTHRNGAGLIASTFLAGQLALAALSILPGIGVHRLCMARPLAFLRVRIVTAVVLASSLIAAVVVVVLARSVLEELDAASLALLAVALAGGPL